MSARRIENPNVDDLGQGGMILTQEEFEHFLTQLGDTMSAGQLDWCRQAGFVAPLLRTGLDAVFRQLGMQADVQVLAVCREDSLEAMREHVLSLSREGTWPAPE